MFLLQALASKVALGRKSAKVNEEEASIKAWKGQNIMLAEAVILETACRVRINHLLSRQIHDM